MIKYIPEDTLVVFEEIPEEVTLALNISNCQNNCKGCHSPYLRLNKGDELTTEAIDALVSENEGITCICFMGEGNDKAALIEAAKNARKSHPELKIALYSGRDEVEDDVYEAFNYVKVGPYKEEFGPLNKKTTNQRLYEVHRVKHIIGGDQFKNYKKTDITEKFWK